MLRIRGWILKLGCLITMAMSLAGCKQGNNSTTDKASDGGAIVFRPIPGPCTAPLKLDHQKAFLIANRGGVRSLPVLLVDLSHGANPEWKRAASCHPIRSWPLSRRSGRFPPLPYPPLRSWLL